MRMITGISRICANVPTAPDRKSTKRGEKGRVKELPRHTQHCYKAQKIKGSATITCPTHQHGGQQGGGQLGVTPSATDLLWQSPGLCRDSALRGHLLQRGDKKSARQVKEGGDVGIKTHPAV